MKKLITLLLLIFMSCAPTYTTWIENDVLNKEIQKLTQTNKIIKIKKHTHMNYTIYEVLYK